MNIVLWGCLLGLMLLQLVVLLFAWRHLARRLRELAEAPPQASPASPPQTELLNAMARIEARLRRLETAEPPPPAPRTDDRAYELAQRMARNGADATQIAEACGLAPHEAELLCRLHAVSR